MGLAVRVSWGDGRSAVVHARHKLTLTTSWGPAHSAGARSRERSHGAQQLAGTILSCPCLPSGSGYPHLQAAVYAASSPDTLHQGACQKGVPAMQVTMKPTAAHSGCKLPALRAFRALPASRRSWSTARTVRSVLLLSCLPTYCVRLGPTQEQVAGWRQLKRGARLPAAWHCLLIPSPAATPAAGIP